MSFRQWHVYLCLWSWHTSCELNEVRTTPNLPQRPNTKQSTAYPNLCLIFITDSVYVSLLCILIHHIHSNNAWMQTHWYNLFLAFLSKVTLLINLAIQGFWAIFSHETNNTCNTASEISVISPAVVWWSNINQSSPSC